VKQMSITECPHCYRRVIPAPSGECPSCGKNVVEEGLSGKAMRLLVVHEGDSFPAICFSCGQPAQNLVKVRLTNVDAAASIGRAVFGLLVPFGRIFSAFSAAKHDVFVKVKLPVCGLCRKQKMKPQVQSYDLESREARLVVHERLRQAVAKP